MIEAVKVVASVREPAMLEPIPTVVTLNESITITMLETATLAAFCEPRSTSPGPSKAAAVMPRHCAVMAMAAAVTARHCAVMATATMASAVAAAPTAASITSAATMASTIASAVAAASAAPAATPAPAVAAASAAATTPAAAAAAAMAHEGHCATGAESAFQVGDTCRLSRPPHKGS
jgi:hypothetical protein